MEFRRGGARLRHAAPHLLREPLKAAILGPVPHSRHQHLTQTAMSLGRHQILLVADGSRFDAVDTGITVKTVDGDTHSAVPLDAPNPSRDKTDEGRKEIRDRNGPLHG
ncbi:hypothetical protein MNVM_05620 [Mycobacterium novum]|uniref:Uncharacterized protein n=2 Tax=Mycobacteriaceae TaxID=1762 RepID=A0A7I9Y6H5_MYCAL|nr:hypothetical protein MNVM_05620 [Mycobacterium novum]GFG84261.1 hypothetical protein MALGJ_09370 [Mycolicibacter algericus]